MLGYLDAHVLHSRAVAVGKDADRLGAGVEVLMPREDRDGQRIGLRFPVEPSSGALRARRAVKAVVSDAMRLGVEYRTEAILPPVDGTASAW